MAEIKRLFIVDGKPFLPVGAEFLCQTGYSARDEAEIEEAFKAIKTAHGNAGEFPGISGTRWNRRKASMIFPAWIR